MKPYDREEKELMESTEQEKWVSVNNLEEEIKKAREAARATITKSERMNNPISPNDLRRLKISAPLTSLPRSSFAEGWLSLPPRTALNHDHESLPIPRIPPSAFVVPHFPFRNPYCPLITAYDLLPITPHP